MKEYNEQVVETLDDAGCIIANKNIIIDNFQARIAELEGDVAIERASRKYWEDAYSEWINTDKAAQGLIAKDERIAELEAENERLKEIEQTNDTLLDQLGDKNAALLDEVASQKHCYAEAVAHYEKQLAASQAYAEQLRGLIPARTPGGFVTLGKNYMEAEDKFNDPYSKMCKFKRVYLDKCEKALALHRDTSALDAYVSEKVKEETDRLLQISPELRKAMGESQIALWISYCDKKMEVEELTRQRDLAVEVMRVAAEQIRKCDYTPARSTLLVAIKESEAMAQGEKKGV